MRRSRHSVRAPVFFFSIPTQVWEKAGVMVSVVYGEIPAEALLSVLVVGAGGSAQQARVEAVTAHHHPRLLPFALTQPAPPAHHPQQAAAHRAAAPTRQVDAGVPFFSASLSAVLHPRNPFAPTLHASFSFFEVCRVGRLIR